MIPERFILTHQIKRFPVLLFEIGYELERRIKATFLLRVYTIMNYFMVKFTINITNQNIKRVKDGKLFLQWKRNMYL